MRYVALALGTIVIGLAVHLHGDPLPPAVRDVLGDALWATMATWWISAIAPALRWSTRTLVALAFCFAIELSQLVRFPAFDTLRGTTVGHLVLGSDFDPRDLVAYTAGVIAAMIFERVIVRRQRES
jgi:hypothetical protein